jgi:hypothetical protein
MRYILTLLFLFTTFCGGGTPAFSRNPAGSGTESFTWTTGRRALTKANARGTTIRYFYGSVTYGTVTGTDDLTNVACSDSAPAVTYTFDRLGRMAAATGGGVTRALSLTLHGQQESEAWAGGAARWPCGGPGLRFPAAAQCAGRDGGRAARCLRRRMVTTPSRVTWKPSAVVWKH